MPRLAAPALRVAEAWSLLVVAVPDRPKHGAGSPLAAQFAGDSFLVQRACNTGRRHPVLRHLPPHVVDESLLLPVGNDAAIRLHVPAVDDSGELQVVVLEVGHALLSPLGDESSLHLG